MERGHEIKVLDHGFVRLVDYMGSDEAIVEAARISTGRGFVNWKPYKRCKRCDVIGDIDMITVGFAACDGREHDWQEFPRGDLGILEYLYKNRHTTPFEMCELVIDVQVPMDCWRQWIRHRTASVNEYSTRYTEAIDIAARTKPSEWRVQGVTNRQGSGEHIDDERVGVMLSTKEDDLLKLSRAVYEERLSFGVAREQARKDLPLSTYTAARWKCDLKNLLHFLGLRMHPHAQLEIRQYANAVAEIVKALWPRTWDLFKEHDLHGVRLSRSEMKLLRQVMKIGEFAHKGYELTEEESEMLGKVENKLGGWR